MAKKKLNPLPREDGFYYEEDIYPNCHPEQILKRVQEQFPVSEGYNIDVFIDKWSGCPSQPISPGNPIPICSTSFFITDRDGKNVEQIIYNAVAGGYVTGVMKYPDCSPLAGLKSFCDG